MPKRPGAQGHVGLGERVGEVVQLTGKLSRWRVRLVLPHKKIPHRHAYSPHRTCNPRSATHTFSQNAPLALIRPLLSPPPPPFTYDQRQVSHGRQPGAECLSEARNQAAMEAVEGARQRKGQCARRVMRDATPCSRFALRPCHLVLASPTASPCHTG